MRIASFMRRPLRQVMQETGSGLETEIWLAYLDKVETEERKKKWTTHDKWEYYIAKLIREIRILRGFHPAQVTVESCLSEWEWKEKKPEAQRQLTEKERRDEASEIILAGLRAMAGDFGTGEVKTQLPPKG
jgi:hypothetical protein